MQIFFPYSQQLYPEEFPGSDPNDCPRDTAKAKWVQFDGNNRFYICPLIRPKHQISFALNLQLVLSGWQHYLEILTISAPGFECWPWLNLITAQSAQFLLFYWSFLTHIYLVRSIKLKSPCPRRNYLFHLQVDSFVQIFQFYHLYMQEKFIQNCWNGIKF